MNGLAFPSDFAGADDVINNLAKEKEPGIEIIERTPYKSLIITLVVLMILLLFRAKEERRLITGYPDDDCFDCFRKHVCWRTLGAVTWLPRIHIKSAECLDSWK